MATAAADTLASQLATLNFTGNCSPLSILSKGLERSDESKHAGMHILKDCAVGCDLCGCPLLHPAASTAPSTAVAIQQRGGLTRLHEWLAQGPLRCKLDTPWEAGPDSLV
jgi:hypothetical protein